MEPLPENGTFGQENVASTPNGALGSGVPSREEATESHDPSVISASDG